MKRRRETSEMSSAFCEEDLKVLYERIATVRDSRVSDFSETSKILSTSELRSIPSAAQKKITW